MSNPKAVSMTTVDDILAEEGGTELLHYGKKGMKWGVRTGGVKTVISNAKDRQAEANRKLREPVPVQSKTVVTPKRHTKIKTQGGENQPAHPDAIQAKEHNQKLKKSGLDTLSNKELQELTKRIQLEKKITELNGDKNTTLGRKILNGLLKDPNKTLDTVNTVTKLVQPILKKKRAA